MGVGRTDYLVWGVKLDPKSIGNIYDRFEAEICGDPGKRFDMVYDGMSGKYAVAGKVIAKSDPYEGLDFVEIDSAAMGFDTDAVRVAVEAAIGDDQCGGGFRLYLFSHWH